LVRGREVRAGVSDAGAVEQDDRAGGRDLGAQGAPPQFHRVRPVTVDVEDAGRAGGGDPEHRMGSLRGPPHLETVDPASGGGARQGVRGHGARPTVLSPAVSGSPSARFIDWIAPPAVPLARLSIAAVNTARPT